MRLIEVLEAEHLLLWLQGATNVLLDGVYHSMSQIGSVSEPSGHLWYGSDSVVDHWLCHLVDRPVNEVDRPVKGANNLQL